LGKAYTYLRLAMASDTLSLSGELKGHGGWVTALATTTEEPDWFFLPLVTTPLLCGPSFVKRESMAWLAAA